MLRQVITVCLLVAFTSQDSPATVRKWGEVTPDELALISLAEDPEADAVVLFDLGKVSITTDFKLLFNRHRRVKILTEKGKENADVSIMVWQQNKVRSLKAQTIQPDGSKQTVDKKQIFEKTYPYWKEKVFAFPGVQTGSILEYEYEILSDYLHFLAPWYFQNQEFTRLSELIVTMPPGYLYNAFYSNVPPQHRQPKEEIIFEVSRGKLKEFTWKMEDLPALKSEAFVKNQQEYASTLFFQLVSYQEEYYYYKFIDSWEDLAKEVQKQFGDYFTQDKGLKSLSKAKVTGISSGLEGCKALYAYVTRRLQTTNGPELYENHIDQPSLVESAKKGSATEKNLLLINLLRHSGYKASPLLISTRDNGTFFKDWPHLLQFNHILINLEVEGQTYILDAQDQYCPFGLLPPEDYAGQGLLVSDEGGRIINLPHNLNPGIFKIETKSVLLESGELRCNSILSYQGYQAAEQKEELARAGDQVYLEEKLKEFSLDFRIDSFSIKGSSDPDSLLICEIHYVLTQPSQSSGEFTYLSVPLFTSLQSNPFVKPSRSFPVEFDYPIMRLESGEITIPASYRVQELPARAVKSINKVNFEYAYSAEGSVIRYQRLFKRDKALFVPLEYSGLRDMYEQMVNADRAQIVLGTQN